MPGQQDPLAGLRDIHLPAPVSAWPPAPGWWMLAAVLLSAMLLAAFYSYRRHRNNRYRRLALQQLAAIENHIDTPNEYLQALNRLLKRTALAAQFHTPVAGLQGQPWLEFLDTAGATDSFCNGVGRLLLQGPYAPRDPALDTMQLQKLHRLAANWIRQHRTSGGGHRHAEF